MGREPVPGCGEHLSCRAGPEQIEKTGLRAPGRHPPSAPRPLEAPLCALLKAPPGPEKARASRKKAKK